MKNFLVLIADIEGSKKIQEEEREKLQQNLQDLLETLNEENKNLISPYTITLGDEFQAVFKKADGFFVDVLKILATMHPVSVRFSLGIGSIATPINKEQAIGMDGPAFHESREGIQQLKKNGFLFSFRIEGVDDPQLRIINNSMQLVSQEMRKWNKRRLLIFQMLKEGYNYKEIARELEISEVSFYKNKEAGALDIIDALSDNIAQIINEKLG